MRVIHVAPTPFGVDGLFGGGERYPLELARALAAHVDCRLLTFGVRPAAILDPSGLRIRMLRAVYYHHGHPVHPLAPGLPFSLDADVIHTHHLKSLPGKMAALTAQATGARLAVTDHGMQGGDWGGLLQHLFDRFLPVSAYSARQMGAPPGRTRVIYGGADPQRFFPDPLEDRSGVLFVGRITPHKGVERLIEALPEGADLIVAGSEGHDKKAPESGYPTLLRRLASGRDVQFTGPISDEQLSVMYRRARVLVLPSVERTVYGREIAVSELLGLVVLEAMMSGTPVICSAVGGLPEIVEDGVTGFLVVPGNVECLRERIEQILYVPGLARRMGNAAREAALERFTWDGCARRCLDAYSEPMPMAPS